MNNLTVLKTLSVILVCLSLWSCSNQQQQKMQAKEYFELTGSSSNDILFRVPSDEYELGAKFCYLNQDGDTIVPFNKFVNSYTDTIVNYGIVMEKRGEDYHFIGINNQGQKLYEIYWYDNGPDYISDGLFRILRNEKIGFADADGNIIIPPQFSCAFPFSDGAAKVTFDCVLEKEFDHLIPKSDTWFLIDKKGQKIK